MDLEVFSLLQFFGRVWGGLVLILFWMLSVVPRYPKHASSIGTVSQTKQRSILPIPPWKTGTLDTHFTLLFLSQGRCCKSAYFWSWWAVLVSFCGITNSVEFHKLPNSFCSLRPPGIQDMLVRHQLSTSGRPCEKLKHWTYIPLFFFLLKRKTVSWTFHLNCKLCWPRRGKCGCNEMTLHTHFSVTVLSFEIAWGLLWLPNWYLELLWSFLDHICCC